MGRLSYEEVKRMTIDEVEEANIALDLLYPKKKG